MPSFAKYFRGQFRRREELKAAGVLVPSARWPGWLELTEDVECGSPSFAAELLVGAHAMAGSSGGRGPADDIPVRPVGLGPPLRH